MTLRARGSARYKSALPVFSVDTMKEARSLQIFLCKKTYDGRYCVPNFKGAIADLFRVSEKIAELYADWKVRYDAHK